MLDQLLARLLAQFHREEGQDLVEYALVAALISVAIAVATLPGPLDEAFGSWVAYVAGAITS